MMTKILTTTALVIFTGVSVWAEASDKTTATLKANDRKFVVDSAKAGMAEVTMAQTALERAVSPEVKELARQLVETHSRANEELKQIASQKGIELPTELADEHKQVQERLSKLSGADFDKAFVREIISDQKKAIWKFEKAARTGEDAEVKQYASTTLPKLQGNLDLAKTTEKTASKPSKQTGGAGSEENTNVKKDQ